MTITDSRFGLRYSSSHGSEDVVNDSRHKPAADIWQALGPLTAIRSFPKGGKLFPQGRPAKGVFVIEQGEVKVFLSADPKLSQTFDVPGPGSVLGLSESVSGREYRVTAQAATRSELLTSNVRNSCTSSASTAISACRLRNA
jgi:Cyclic nucleotide-binding domain